MLIGLGGKLQSGKDTVFNIIKEFHPEAEKFYFTKKMKESAAALFGIDPELWEKYKNDELESLLTLELGKGEVVIHMTIRQFLQRYGTEAHRNIFGEDYWLDDIMPEDFDHSNRFVVVKDMRMPNEIERIIELSGFTVKVEKNGLENSDHPTENEIPDELIDWHLDNNGSREELKNNVKTMLRVFEEAC
jgi:hypothetical protein